MLRLPARASRHIHGMAGTLVWPMFVRIIPACLPAILDHTIPYHIPPSAPQQTENLIPTRLRRAVCTLKNPVLSCPVLCLV